MRKMIAKQKLKRFAARYHYDVGYMRHMLEQAPGAFFKFVKIIEAAGHVESAPAEAVYAAKIAGALAEDCGPCAQLVVDMALEAGVPADQAQAVLKRDVAAMSEDAAIAFRFADAVIRRSPEADHAREAVRAQWGDAGVIDLTLGMQVGRLFPMVKAGLGFAKSCQRIEIDGAPVDVVKNAA